MTQNNGVKPDEKIAIYVELMIKDLIPGFLENRQNDITTLYNALEQEDYKAVRIIGHGMKGVGGSYGFDEITNIGGLLERAAIDKNLKEIQRLVVELSRYLDRIDIIYDSPPGEK